MIELHDVFDPCGPNTGGLNFIQVIPVDSVASIPKAIDGIIPAAITLKPGATFYQLAFADNTGSFKEPAQEDDQGEFFKPAVQVFMPKDNPLIVDFVQKGKSARYILQYQDANGFAKVVGSLAYPLKFKAELDTGTGGSSKNGHTLTFSGESPDKAFFYQMALVPTDGSLPDWTPGGSGQGGSVTPEVAAVTNQTTLTLTHDKAYPPFVQCVDSGGHVVDFACQHISSTQLKISFSYAFTGTIIYL